MPVLVLSNQQDATADYLCARMREDGLRHLRLDTEVAPSRCSVLATPEGLRLTLDDVALMPSDVGALWYRRPVPVGCVGGGDRYDQAFAAAEWTAALEGFLNHIPAKRWVNHPASIMAASAKLEQLTRAARHGLTVPTWCCTTRTEDALRFLGEQEAVIAKPLYCGHIERESPAEDTVIYTSRVQLDDLRATGPCLGTPTLFQRQVAGADVRVTVVDEEVTAVRLWHPDGRVDIRRDNMRAVQYAPQDVPKRVRAALLALVRSYELRFAAVDLMVTSDAWYFLEVNPNGQWAWLDIVGGAEIYKAFLSAFRAAD